MTENWYPPENHPLSPEQSRRLLQGELGDVYRSILAGCCAPIYWHRRATGFADVCGNGTLTFVKTTERLIGVTAAHVLVGYQEAKAVCDVALRVFDSELVGGCDVIDINRDLDIATISLDAAFVQQIGKEVSPLEGWPPLAPEEGRGIMLAGYPGLDRRIMSPREIDWGLFTALGISRVVTSHQITWRVEREYGIPHPKIPDLPPNRVLGGISGGPLIAWFETPSHVIYPRLAGIISEAQESLENVVARRADFILSDGRIVSVK